MALGEGGKKLGRHAANATTFSGAGDRDRTGKVLLEPRDFKSRNETETIEPHINLSTENDAEPSDKQGLEDGFE